MNIQLGEEVVRQLAKLSQAELLALTVAALIGKRDPLEAIDSVSQLLSTLTQVVNDAGRLEIAEKFRDLADAAERPILQAHIAKNWN